MSITNPSDTEQHQPVPDWLTQYMQATGTVMPDATDAANEGLHTLFSQLARLNGEEINYRANEIRRLLRNSGFIETGEKRRWRLDPLPLLVSPNEWQLITAGIEQRVGLLNRVVQDLCGEQQLLTSGLVDARQLLSHPYYLRECASLKPVEPQLFLVAVDIGREPDGQLYVMNDHCQIPRGLGLLLENRIVARRVMSEEFAECGVRRIAVFFQQIQQAINQATQSIRDPRVVILSRGPEDPYYSEQAYLATYLGYTLVRSADLTVRKGKVWLKALDGLKKVDVILRWIEDRHLDSLEQTEYSEHGISGLLQAVRSQQVVLLNPFGNGLMQIPAIRNALPAIADSWMGQPLLLNEPETLTPEQAGQGPWDTLELRSYTDPELRLDGLRDASAIQTLLDTSNHNNVYFWRKVNLGQAPFWHRRQLVAKPVIMRCYALCFGGEVHVLPSAMCHTPAHGVANARIAIKDTWIQAVGPHLPDPPLIPKTLRKTTDLALLEGLIPSRTAENLFWLGCGLERCEDLARLLRLFIDRFTEMAMYPDSRHTSTLQRMKEGLLQHELTYPYQTKAVQSDDPEPTFKTLVQDVMQDATRMGGLHSTVSMVLNSALQVRELLSYDSLRIIENLETELRRLEKIHRMTPTHSLQSSLDKIIGLVMAFNGSMFDSLSNSNGSFMIDMGKRVERSTQLVAMLKTMLHDDLPEADQQSALEAVLVAQVSSVTHRRRYRMYQSIETGLELLLLDAEYPRSLAYQIEQLVGLCQRLPSKAKPGFISATEKILLQLKSACCLADRETLAAVEDGSRPALMQLMDIIQQHLKTFDEMLQTQYFTHTKTATKLNWSAENPLPKVVAP